MECNHAGRDIYYQMCSEMKDRCAEGTRRCSLSEIPFSMQKKKPR